MTTIKHAVTFILLWTLNFLLLLSLFAALASIVGVPPLPAVAIFTLWQTGLISLAVTVVYFIVAEDY